MAPIIGTILLVAITVTAATLLYLLRPALPPVPVQISYLATTGSTEPTWGDGSDCSKVNGVETCWQLPVVDITITQEVPPTILISSLAFDFVCNGTLYLSAPLATMEWVPTVTGSPEANAPQLGHCGSYTPPKAAFNRLAFFFQLDPGSDVLHSGDTLVVFLHSFQPPNCPNPKYGSNGSIIACDDDFHGAPSWCYSVPGSCSIELFYAGQNTDLAMVVPLAGLSS